MKTLLDWLDDRTGLRQLVREALYERVPGGARWRYVWGSTLVVAFVTQMITGLVLWTAYSPSTLTAWESVYYIEHQMPGGWLLRGVHHYTAQLMIVLLVLHLMQVVIDGAYRAPREVNFWLGLVLMMLVLGLSLTGYLLPWDQKGYWATRVATNLIGLVPLVGGSLQQLLLGGPDYGHHTLTRFFALHAGLLPGLLIFFLVLHVALFRRHGLHAKERLPRRPDAHFWPDQVLKDSVAGLAVLAAAIGLTLWARAELGPPADPASAYDARPEWYFLSLFQLLKYFPGRAEVIGALVIPSIVLVLLLLMPLIGRWKLGHRFNVAFLLSLIAGLIVLTGQALHEDYYAVWHTYDPKAQFEDPAALAKAIANDPARTEEVAAYEERFERSRQYLAGAETARREAERAVELARLAGGIPPTGALAMLRDDPKTQGPKLFRQHCAACHDHAEVPNPSPTAPNLTGFATRDWLDGLLDPKQIATARYFGYHGSPFAEGDMVAWVQSMFADLDEAGEQERQAVVAALSAEAELPTQAAIDRRDAERITQGRELIKTEIGCTDCHKFHDAGTLGSTPDLTGYGSQAWLRAFISDPSHARFYRDSNDRMPAFAPTANSQTSQLDAHSLDLLVDWLRGDWPKASDSNSASSKP